MKLKEGPFEFQTTDNGWKVFYRRRNLGDIIGMKESSGRHCFRLAIDTRKEPRTYRGKVKAAEALQSLDALSREAKRRKWSNEMLVLQAWDKRPTVSESTTS